MTTDEMNPSFNEPENEDILQADEEPMSAIPVVVTGVVRTDEMPCRNATFKWVLLKAGSDAQKIVNDNPRRKRLVVTPYINLDSESVVAFVADTFGEAQAFRGHIVAPGANQVMPRYEWAYSGEMFARPGAITDSTGIFTAINPSTQDLIISISEEEWAN